jgi:hypothetical protein
MPYRHPVAILISVLWWGAYFGCLGAGLGALLGLFADRARPTGRHALPRGSSRSTSLSRTRASLFFPASYLVVAGVGFILFPEFNLRLLFSTGHYERIFVELCGLFLLGLAALVIQTIRFRLAAIYPTLIGVRVFFCVGYMVLYGKTRDPLFLSLLAIVGSGLLASTICLARDRRDLIALAGEIGKPPGER